MNAPAPKYIASLLLQVVLALTLLALATHAEAASHSTRVDTFHTLVASGEMQLELSQERQGSQLTVIADGSAEALRQVRVESVDGVLYVEAQPEPNAGEVHLTVYIGDLSDVVIDGAVELAGEDLQVDDLTIEGHGSGIVHLANLRATDLVVHGTGSPSFSVSGTVVNQVVDLAGAGHYFAANLSSETSQVSIRGAGYVDVWVDDLLDVVIAGTARVRYAGQPWVQQQVSGRGGVERM